jgi:hypothetical protein
MSNSYANQLGWCITTKDYLNNLNNEMIYVASLYNNMVDELQAQGYMTDALPIAQNMNNEFQKEVIDIVKYIEDEHLSYIQKQSNAISSELNKLMQI